MGDQVDEFNVPVAIQSGNNDRGHISDLPATILSQQAGQLNTVLQNYYGEQSSYNELTRQLYDLGYSQDQTRELLEDAHEERVYRVQNGHPSNLSPNQLEALHDSFGSNYLAHMEIHTDVSGRQYVDDHRTREVDGTLARFYLPVPIAFNPLTQNQQAEVALITQAGEDIHITPDENTEQTQLTDRQIEEVMTLATHYLNSDPENRDDERLQFRNNVQQIRGLNNVEDINNQLQQLFIDIEGEYGHREENNGIPRTLSETQYNYLRQNQIRTGYTGQIILTERGTGLQYYYTSRGKTPVLTDEQIQVLSREVQFNEFDIRATNDQNIDLTNVFADYLGDRITREETIQRIQVLAQYNPENPAKDPFRADMYQDFINNLDRVDLEKNFREQNNGRPSQLSQLQYDYLLNHALISDQEERYNDQIIFVNRDGSVSYMMSNGIYLNIPSDQTINQYMEDGFYNPIDTDIDPTLVITDEDLRPPPPRPIAETPVLPTAEQIRDIASGEQEFDPDDPLGLLDVPHIPPQQFEVLQTQLGNIILPQEIPSTLPQPSRDVSPQSYTDYFMSSQDFFIGFRQVTSNIVTTSFTMGGAFIGYSFAVARQRLVLRNFATETEVLMNQLENLVVTFEQQLTNTKIEIEETEQALSERELSLATDEALLTDEGYTVLEQFNREVGRVRERVNLDYIDKSKLERLVITNPTIKGLARNIEDLNAEAKNLAIDISDLEDVRIEIEKNKEEAQQLETMVLDNTVRRDTINTQLRTVIDNNYKIFFDVVKYRREILTGAGIGGALGSTLSLIMAGYTYPTVIGDEEDIFIPEQYKSDNKVSLNEKEESEKKQKQTLLEQKYKPIQKEINMLPPVQTPARNIFKTKSDFKTQKFIPIKDNGSKPLTQKQIFELQSTLSPNELEKLRGKYLIFGSEGVETIKTNDRCKQFNPLSDDNIKSRSVRIR